MNTGTAFKQSGQSDGKPTTSTGVTVADVFAVFRGAKVFEIRGGCPHCSKDYIPKWRRGGKLVEAIYPDGQKKRICNYCGRTADLVSETRFI